MPEDRLIEIDLHESEWKRAGKREPILGHGAKSFFIYLFSGLAVATFMKWALPAIGAIS